MKGWLFILIAFVAGYFSHNLIYGFIHKTTPGA